MSGPKVCMISTVHSAFDDRIFYKEAITLAKHGYNVSFIVPHDGLEYVKGVEIVPLKKRKSRLSRIVLSPLEALIIATKKRCRVCHFHDPELLFMGVFCKLLGKKVIYDVHEDVAAQVVDKSWIKVRFIRRVLSKIFPFIEKLVSKSFDAVVCATPDIANHFNHKNVVVLRNLVILEMIDKAKPIDRIDNSNIIVYAGGLTKNRGILNLVKAMHYVKNAELWLLGSWESKEFISLCKSQKGWERVKYIGNFKMEEVYPYLKGADVGIALLLRNPNYLRSLPVKAFEYMAAGLPMIISNFDYWVSLFKGAALFADPESPEDIADKLNILLGNKGLQKKLGETGRRLVINKYNWEMESERLTKLYKRII